MEMGIVQSETAKCKSRDYHQGRHTGYKLYYNSIHILNLTTAMDTLVSLCFLVNFVFAYIPYFTESLIFLSFNIMTMHLKTHD